MNMFGEEDFDFSDDGERSERNEEIKLKFLFVQFESAKAWLIKFAAEKKVWLPKSQCEFSEDEERVVYVPVWLVDENDLWEFEKTEE